MANQKNLKDCCTIIAGQSPASKYYNQNKVGLPFFQGKADFGTLYPTARVYCSEPMRIAEEGDILLSVRAPVGATNFAPYKCCIGRGLTAIRPNKMLNRKYLLYFLRYYEAHLSEKGTGTTFKAITQQIVRAIKLSIPPLPMQEKLVIKIEDLFSELDKAVDALQTIRQQVAVCRMAALRHSFGLFKEYRPLGRISESRLGKMLDKEKNLGHPCKYLRNINVRWFVFSLDDLLEIKIQDKEMERFSVQKGDLLICEGGEPGRCAVWEKEERIFYQKALHRVRFVVDAEPRLYMYYLYYAVKIGLLPRFFTGTGIKHLVGSSLVKVPVPYADIRLQRKVLNDIESRLSVCDNIECTVNTALQQAAALRQSILKQAFEGKLIP